MGATQRAVSHHGGYQCDRHGNYGGLGGIGRGFSPSILDVPDNIIPIRLHNYLSLTRRVGGMVPLDSKKFQKPKATANQTKQGKKKNVVPVLN